MQAPVTLDRAREIIQNWYNEYCRVADRTAAVLEVTEDEQARAYRVSNPETGDSSVVFWSTVGDFERYGGSGIPGDLMGSVWDAFSDL